MIIIASALVGILAGILVSLYVIFFVEDDSCIDTYFDK